MENESQDFDYFEMQNISDMELASISYSSGWGEVDDCGSDCDCDCDPYSS